MTKKAIWILALILTLTGLVVWEQVYTDNAIDTMLQDIVILENNIAEQNLEASRAQAQSLIDFWDKKESIICLFVDFRDIEQIGRQVDLVYSHLENSDFELATVECNTLQRVIETFRDMIKFDWQNIF